jgi:DNA-binding transcriptional regulator YhcF (GntR family)
VKGEILLFWNVTGKHRRGAQALYVQVAGKIEALIRSGVLRAGERVPSLRRASLQLGVSVTTAVQAYVALENRGLMKQPSRAVARK